jgi:2-dehydropantoate 2-reductase
MLYPLGELDGSVSDRIVQLSQLFETAGLKAPVEPEIRRNIWRKVMNNAALNPVSALTRATMHRMLGDPPVRALLKRLIEESIAVAKASGVDPLVDAEERLRWAEHLADVRTSMLQDLEAGKQLELDPIDGAVVELAGRYGVDVPALDAIYALTKLLERTVRV